MIYKFKSKATSDIIMMGPNGDEVLKLLGRTPSAQGVIDVADMPGALAMLERALAQEEAAQREDAGADEAGDDGQAQDGRPERKVGLRQRVWPLMEAIKRAHAEGEPLVWGA